MMRASVLMRLDARDRALFARCVLGNSSARSGRMAWIALTHMGGATVTICAALAPLAMPGPLRAAALQALLALVLSHLLVQLVKRTAGRPRPSTRNGGRSVIEEPDKFSFPSGHAAASMSVAFVYASIFAGWMLGLLLVAATVGFSRVRLGVHYPGDVIVGQVIAILTAVAVLAAW